MAKSVGIRSLCVRYDFMGVSVGINAHREVVMVYFIAGVIVGMVISLSALVLAIFMDYAREKHKMWNSMEIVFSIDDVDSIGKED